MQRIERTLGQTGDLRLGPLLSLSTEKKESEESGRRFFLGVGVQVRENQKLKFIWDAGAWAAPSHGVQSYGAHGTGAPCGISRRNKDFVLKECKRKGVQPSPFEGREGWGIKKSIFLGGSKGWLTPSISCSVLSCFITSLYSILLYDHQPFPLPA